MSGNSVIPKREKTNRWALHFPASCFGSVSRERGRSRKPGRDWWTPWVYGPESPGQHSFSGSQKGVLETLLHRGNSIACRGSPSPPNMDECMWGSQQRQELEPSSRTRRTHPRLRMVFVPSDGLQNPVSRKPWVAHLQWLCFACVELVYKFQTYLRWNIN